MKILETPQQVQSERQKWGPRTGFVPTMGALHEGHLELVRQSQKNNAITIVSIFLNPTQFNNPEDLSAYPQQIEKDLLQLENLGVDYVFLPDKKAIYPDDYTYKITESHLSQKLCGASRPGHFDGVLTVVMKLFHLIQPKRAYFGEKDFQQLKLIEGMVQAFFMDIEIVPVKTVRDDAGLALSSRNQRLNVEEKKKAQKFAALFQAEPSLEFIEEKLQELDVKVDYLDQFDGRRYAAVNVGPVRLIDNVKI